MSSFSSLTVEFWVKTFAPDLFPPLVLTRVWTRHR